MKTYWESGGIAPLILNLETRWRCSRLHAPAGLLPGKKSAGTHGSEAGMCPRASLDAVAKKKILDDDDDDDNNNNNNNNNNNKF
jgi:hypothetical protein